MRISIEQRLRRQDLAVLAEAALRHLLLDPRPLKRMQGAVLREPLERGDLALHRRCGRHARSDRGAADDDRAGAALAQSAAEFRTLEAEVVAQSVQQRRQRLDVHGARDAVHLQGDRAHGVRAPCRPEQRDELTRRSEALSYVPPPMKSRRLLPAIVVVGLAVAGAAAQQRPRIPPTGAIKKVRDNLYVIPGAGGNTTVFVTQAGVVLVDTKLPNNGEAILTQVRTVTDKPVSTIINTHSHPDHIGSNEYFPA